MTPDLVVQYIVTALILGVVAWFVVRRLRGAAHAPGVLHDGDRVDLVRVRHIDNGDDLVRGKADSAQGGSLMTGPSFMTLTWVFGSERIDHARMRDPRIRAQGLARVLIFEMDGEGKYWAVWIDRNKLPALVAHLAGKGVTVATV